VYIGRQPILGNDQKLFSYELLFRHNAAAGSARVVSDEDATSRLLVNAFNQFGIEQVVGEKRAFVNVSGGMLMSEVIESLPQDKVVLEILESVKPTPEVVDRCRGLQAKGYQLALDDFVYRPEFEPLLGVAAYVKLDIRALGLERTAKEVMRLRGRGLRLIAEKVETCDEFRACRSMMFNHYQGYYFARPETLSAKRIDPSTQHVMQVFNLVIGHAEQSVIEAAFKQDVALSYGILRYINSVGFGLMHKVETINRALVVLGHAKLARWLSLLLMSGSSSVNVAPHALFRTALARARLVELLGKRRLPVAQHDYLFLTGMFSLLDAMLDKSMADLLVDLSLPETVRDALLNTTGPFAVYLQIARACEDFQPETIEALARPLGMDPTDVSQAHMQALAWTEEVASAAA
jgi:EAL and modified HD-GYP domain-containing signal transduction protein